MKKQSQVDQSQDLPVVCVWKITHLSGHPVFLRKLAYTYTIESSFQTWTLTQNTPLSNLENIIPNPSHTLLIASNLKIQSLKKPDES
jgi:hypothetical protein